MDAHSRRVASEIVEAGLGRTPAIGAVSLAHLDRAFLAIGDLLAEADTDARVRTFPSLHGDDPEAVALRESVAVDFHRKAAELVAVGARVAALAFALGGMAENEAIGSAAWHLRSEVVEDGGVPGTSTDDLMACAHLNYVRAAGELSRLTEDGGYADFAQSVLSVIAIAVAAAAYARAVEQSA